MAVRPGALGLDWPEAFGALEHHVARVVAALRAMPFEWFLNPTPQDFPHQDDPSYQGREGWMNLVVLPAADQDAVRVLIRASLPFRGWPLGCWVVWEGFLASRTSAPRDLSVQELGDVW